MGSIVKGVASLFGGKARRREQKGANKEFEANKKAVQNFKFKNHYEGLNAAQQDVAQLGPASQAQAGTLGASQGYQAQNAEGSFGAQAQGYQSQGYDAAQSQLERSATVDLGEDTGFRNNAQDLQVNTAAADAQARESDQALAASQDAAAQAGSGAGGATALAAAALKSKQGVADTLSAQESQNAQLRAQGADVNQQAALAQRNTSRSNEQSQNQFNAGQANQNSQFNAGQTNQARAFTAGAANEASRFGAQANNQFALQNQAAQNQFALQNTSAQNSAAQFGASNANSFAQAQFGANNQFALANQSANNNFALQQFGAQNSANAANASSANQFSLAKAQGAATQEQNRYNQKNDALGLAGQRKSAADGARAQAKSDLVGGIAGAAGALFSDERLKENIKKVGKSPSGINIYQYNYIGDDQKFEGVIAQEIEGEAKIYDGEFYKVDYSKIDVKFKAIEDER